MNIMEFLQEVTLVLNVLANDPISAAIPQRNTGVVTPTIAGVSATKSYARVRARGLAR